VTFDDLVSWGMEGLMTAAVRFRVDGGASFRTYVGRRIRGAIYDGLRQSDGQSRGTRRTVRRLAAMQAQLMVKLHREPDVDELASAMELDRADVRAILVLASARTVPLDGLVEDPYCVRPEDPFEIVSAGERIGQLAAALRHLPPRQVAVLRLYYAEDRPLCDVGTQVGLSEARVWQLRNEALANLRSILTPGTS
jgi:RNA polymerase sigma factor for flagellar operon FliA